MDLEKGNSGTYSARTMKSGTNLLTYNIYWDAESLNEACSKLKRVTKT